jgi:hypothetical protein
MNCAVHTDVPAVAFCRTCGKALCENCKRDVMGAIYCEPCIAARLQGNSPLGSAAAPVAIVPGMPSPGLAFFLGLIPGVGAWYNGQFLKGFIHVLLYALFIVGVSNVNNGAMEVIFGLLLGFSPIYMAFEAYSTAKAKLLGQPPPDPLGLERIFGLQESQSPAPAATAAPGTTESSASSSTPAVQRGNEPIGAIVLIALGVIFLIGNFTPDLHIHRFWPLILIGPGLWIAYKRITDNRACPCARCRARGLMGAAVLITLGVLFLLHELSRHISFWDGFPVLLIVIGLVMYLGRTASTEGHIDLHRPTGTVPPSPPAADNQHSSEVNQ